MFKGIGQARDKAVCEILRVAHRAGGRKLKSERKRHAMWKSFLVIEPRGRGGETSFVFTYAKIQHP